MALYKGIIAYIEAISRLNGGGSKLELRSNAEVYWPLPECVGKGYFSVVKLRPGMVMALGNLQARAPIKTLLEFSGIPIAFTYTMAGEHSWISSSEGVPFYSWRSGYEILSSFRFQLGEVEVMPASRDPLKAMTIYLDPSAFFDLFPGMENQLPPELVRITKGDAGSAFYREMPATANVQMVMQDILARPYHGPFQRMFLESKGMELMTHTLWRIRRQQAASDLEALRPEYTERVKNAKKIIDRNFCEDINLRDLARQVGLHHSKLSLFFQMLYDTTVFGYVRQLRLNQACFLLSKGENSVTEVALAVGYSNLSHFAKVFKEHWGQTPSRFLRRKSRCS